MMVASRIVNVDELIEEYVASLRAPSTRRSYAATVDTFRRWAGSRGLALVDVETIDLIRYFKEERDRGVSAATIQTRQGALSSFYAFVVTCGLIPVSPMDKVERTKVRRYVAQPTPFSREDVRRLLNTIEARSNRDAAMLMLILLAGWKSQEVLALDVPDIVLMDDHALVEVRGRTVGRSQRLPSVIAKRLKAIVEERTSGPAFLTRNGERMTRYAFRDMTERVGKAAALPTRLTPQGLRNTMLQFALQSGAHPVSIAEAAGSGDLRPLTAMLSLTVDRAEHPATYIVRMLTEPGPLNDLSQQVEALLDEPGIHPVAPIVVAGALLEARLRSMCSEAGLGVTGKPSIARYAEILKSAGVISKLEATELGVLGVLRNQAAHGEDLESLTGTMATQMAHGVAKFLGGHP